MHRRTNGHNARAHKCMLETRAHTHTHMHALTRTDTLKHTHGL